MSHEKMSIEHPATRSFLKTDDSKYVENGTKQDIDKRRTYCVKLAREEIQEGHVDKSYLQYLRQVLSFDALQLFLGTCAKRLPILRVFGVRYLPHECRELFHRGCAWPS